MLDDRNIQTLWASVLVETLARLGVTTAIISPGSRSTPLTLAFATHAAIEAIPILDERSAGFFALGQAQASGRCVVLVCTSGTAGANYFPAVIEARESRWPLLLLTADRPPELRHCASGQTIDQQKLFGDYPNAYAELGLPEASIALLRYLRQTVVHAWERSQHPVPGPVHLNCPFRDPLAPIADDLAPAIAAQLGEDFFEHLQPSPLPRLPYLPSTAPPALAERGVIVAGPAQPPDAIAYGQAVAHLAKTLGWSVLAEGLSPLRNHADLNPYLVTHYEAILRHSEAALVPEQVLQLGPLPTSKGLRQWLAETDPLRWIVDTSDRNLDALHGRTRHLATSVAALAALDWGPPRPPSDLCRRWCERDAIARQRLQMAMETIDSHAETLFEGKLAWLLPQMLPPETPVWIANSTPVRDVEWFWPLNNRGIRPYFNRGGNGIDGTLSAALGMAHNNRSAVLLTGDLALLHDSNGFLCLPYLRGHLTIVLINNQGGGIFEMLPIAEFDPPFEAFFATPQAVDFATLCAAHGVAYERMESWAQLGQRLGRLPERGVRVLEVRCDRKGSAQQRLALLDELGRSE